eukprot:CAMPEP_0201680704 /NCGR_PEP_ID=MMETSP0494-20130426/50735_1 /ASSEMBLY_ACC=CAM_ASM_000839 /TAXON_ID=420259 /ORGANISM="Thalassiosira gravida, Strain GMp14c1" /LENGTH=832 /DNA_ID=CAMNT_0048164431 /DNA_START=144 /DNA_END=2642 /DNA_ORIENTATION=+
MTTTKDLVLVHLRKEKIRLWLPPYYYQRCCDTTSDNKDNANGSKDDDDAMTKLAESIMKKPISRDDDNSNGGSNTATTEEILNALRELQTHAVQKLIDKNSVNVKIVTSRFAGMHITKSNVGDRTAAATAAAATMEGAFSNIASWGDSISIAKNSITTTTHQYDINQSLCLHVTNISPTLTVHEFSTDICRTLNAKTVRIIWKGKNLLSSSSSSGNAVENNSEMDTLRKLLAATSISGTSSSRGSSSTSNQKKESELLCLVSGTGYDVGPPPPPAASSTIVSGTASPSDVVRTDSSVIDSIRTAARTIRNSPDGSAARFEVTDQSGNLVPMRQSDTVAFSTALGLHRIGRSKMERQPTTPTTSSSGGDDNDIDIHQVGVDEEDSGGSGNGRDVASALVFLLEADAEWNNSPALHDWKSKVDNYGLLQLDIAWCYLLLESLDGLDDAIRRLDVAERALRKQVHSNFVTLALAQAEMNNAIPPLCAVFVRLFLLQGVANKIISQRQNGTDDDSVADTTTTSASEERLSRARLLCQRLRSSSPPDSVEALRRAYVVEPSAAIAALRRTNGDPDAAGNCIAMERDEEGGAARKRRRQQRAGRCANGVDFVDLELVVALSGMLGYGNGSVGGDGIIGDDVGDDDDDEESFNRTISTGTMIVIGLLRLSDNSIEKSLELYNSVGADQVMERVARLDEASGRRKRRSTNTKKPAKHDVRDVDLAMLVSMGVEEARCRDALKATGDVESALLWLSKDDNDHDSSTNDEKESKNSSDEAAEDLVGRGINAFETADHEVDDAHELLERELGNVLGADSKQLLEKEWLGVDMQDEWNLIQKYS